MIEVVVVLEGGPGPIVTPLLELVLEKLGPGGGRFRVDDLPPLLVGICLLLLAK